ncbi:choice-of-anchor Q domain-containing protein [Metapseudomonas otitidis]|uniref:choice-of-anchor Q domain-containing protein n=1 Tax=Metapseudomonas otitidis TaxID=319939 RepID=UPI0013F637C0|nr:choice-of-anchor Q domain-containing protein [Pseudomonas otitidis]
MHMPRIASRLGAPCAALSLAFLGLPAGAADFIVNQTDDRYDGVCINFGKVTLRNSIIAGNLDEDLATPMNCDNRGAQAQYKAIGLLLGTGPGNCTGEFYVEQADVMTQVLYPLADNNGRTQTHALRPHSPAVDAGIGTCTARDQRGSKRPRDGDGDGVARCDLGAYERPKPWGAKP